jgi:hypothetical protein
MNERVGNSRVGLDELPAMPRAPNLESEGSAKTFEQLDGCLETGIQRAEAWRP